MKNPDHVLIGIALILLAIVVIYNGLFVAPKKEEETTTVTTTVATTVATTTQTVTTSSSNGKVNINIASAAELETLKGIGPSKAQAIIDYRTEHGDFKSINDLLKVSGIGEKTLANIKDYICV